MVTCYPVRGKKKSFDICEAFARGCGGFVSFGAKELSPDPVFFWGVDESNLDIWKAARARGDYYYGDNSYFDSTRGEYFRVTYNRLQHTGNGRSDGARFARLELEVDVSREAGIHIVVCPQSDSFMRDVAGYAGNWLRDVKEEISQVTDRPIRVRHWNRDKDKLTATLMQDLGEAHALVTFSSAAAVTATLNGTPVFCDRSCAAASICNVDTFFLEHPYMQTQAERAKWAMVLADNQWTLDEMRSGQCWAAIGEEKVAA